MEASHVVPGTFRASGGVQAEAANVLTESEAQDEAKRRATKIFITWTTLREVLRRHEEKKQVSQLAKDGSHGRDAGFLAKGQEISNAQRPHVVLVNRPASRGRPEDNTSRPVQELKAGLVCPWFWSWSAAAGWGAP